MVVVEVVMVVVVLYPRAFVIEDKHISITGYSQHNSTIIHTVRVFDYLFLYVSPLVSWQLVQGGSQFSKPFKE